MKYRTRACAALALTAVAAFAVPATANGETLPADAPTITMTIANETDAPMVLKAIGNPYGEWVDEPKSVVAAHTTEVVTAGSTDRRGFGVQVTYTMPGEATAVFMASNYGTGVANGDGTRVAGPNHHEYATDVQVDAGFPFMNVTYTISRDLP